MRPPRSKQVPVGVAVTVLAASLAAVPASVEGQADAPRTAAGRPDLSGTYDVATLTPLERPDQLGDRAFISSEEAAELAAQERAFLAAASRQSDPEREAPPAGGAPPAGLGEAFRDVGGTGNVGGYNVFWMDRGSSAFALEGRFATSIVVDPANGQLPPMTPEGKARAGRRAADFAHENDGTAWWLALDRPGPFDDPERRPHAERCLLGFGSVSGPPMLPVLYNNLKKIVQTPEHVVILVEMNHDARVVRMNADHLPPTVRRWMGDSIGWWEGDTLVVDTTNFTEAPGLYMASAALHVVERFTRIDRDTLLYEFTVEDPVIWTRSWSGRYPWPASESRVFEYACHEGNYALGNILRGARALEAEAASAAGSGR